MKGKQPQQKDAAKAESGTNAINLLKADHRKVNALFAKYESADGAEEKASIAKQVCNELIVHTTLEEEIFYAACREAGVEDSMLDEAQVEHDSAKLLISALLQNQPDSDYYDARMTVLAEYIKHHVGEEEKAGSGIFARARAAKLDMNALGQRLQQRKEELLRQAQGGELTAPAPRSLDLQSFNRGKQEQSTMARQNDRDRDEQGRFMGDDDQRGGGRGYSARNNERDERGRFMSDDDERSGGGGRAYRDEDSRYSSRGGERGGYESQSRGGSQERGQGGWSGDSEGHSRASQEGWENRGRAGSSSRYGSDEDYGSSRGNESRGGSQGRGQGEWLGNGEGQSRGSREGWESRGRADSPSRYGSDEDYGSSRGGNESRGGSQGRGQGGWFGDAEGHSRASQEGWESRGRSGSSSRYEEEGDSRSSRSGSQGRSQSGQGQGGWFGDPRGHSEASRRGWQNR
jgi:hypothetical protein